MEFKRSSKKVVAFVCALSLMATQLVAMPSTVANKVLNNVSVSASNTDQMDSASRITKVAGTKISSINVVQSRYGWTDNGSNGFYSTNSAYYDNITGDTEKSAYMKNTDQYMEIYFSSDEDFRLSYNYQVSSEGTHDYLSVTLDGSELTRVSGQVTSSYSSNDTIKAGTHVLKLSYSKDVSVSANLDRAWVYNIKIKPAISQPSVVDGYYQITNKQELLWFAEQVNAGNYNINAKLMNDIDYDDIQTKIGSNTYKYNGTFDGNGHTVKVNFNSNTTYTALFSYTNTDSVIKNLIVDGTIKATANYAGGIVGYASGSTVENCAFIGTMNTGTYASCGIMGYATSNPVIKNCYVTGDMTNCTSTESCAITTSTLSGLSNCYYLDTVGAPYVNKWNDATSMTIDQFKSGEVAYKLSHSDDLISDDNPDGFIEGSPWGQNIDIEGQDIEDYPTLNGNKVYVKGIHDPCTAELSGGYSNYDGQVQYIHYYDVNGFDTTTNPEDGTVSFNHKVTDIELYEPATLNDNGYYEIGNMGQLYWFAKQINDGQISEKSNAILTSDIEVAIPEIADVDGNYISTWIPIASIDGMQYQGTFNGNGHVISGLTCINSEENPFDVGFISEIANGAKVINLGIENSTFEDTIGDKLVGSISGNNLGTIANCYSTATVIGGEDSTAGGISGSAPSKDSKILNVYFGGHINSNTPIIGNGYSTTIVSSTSNVYYLSTSFDGDLNTRYNRYAKMVYATASDVPEGITDAIVVSSGQLTYLLERNSSGELLDFTTLGYVPFVQDLPDTLEAITNGTVIDVVPRFAKNTDDATTNLVYKSYLTDTCNQFVTPSECTTIYTNTNGDVIFGIHVHDSGSIKLCEKPTAWTDGMIVNRSTTGSPILNGIDDEKISQTDFNALKPNTVADCVTKAVQWYQCDDCGAYFYVVGSIAANNHNADYSRDGKIDWNDILYIAENDKDNFDKIVNISDSYYPTCTSSGTAYITKCANDNNHSVSVPISYTMEDYYNLRCILEGESFKTKYPTVSNFLDDEGTRAILHRENNDWYKIYYPNGTVLHVLRCKNCGEILSSHVEDIEYSYTTKKHTVESSSCTDNNCGIDECHKVGDTAYHKFYRYSPITTADGTIDASKHHATCYDCGAVVAQPHEFDENGVCICGYDITTDQEKANAAVEINLVPDYNYYGDLETVDDIKKVRFTLSVADTVECDNYYIIRIGVVYTKNLDGTTVDSEDLIIENINGTTIKGAYSYYNGFYMNLTPVTEDDTVAVRAYAVVYDEATDNVFTVYSDVETDTLENTKNNVQEIIDQRNLEKALKDKASVSVEKQEIEGYELYQKAKFVVTRTINNPEDTTYSCVRYGFVYSKNFDYDITLEEAESQLVVENIDGTNIKGAYSSSTSNPTSIYANITNNGTYGLTLFRPYYVVVDDEGNEHIFYGDIVANVGYGIK